MSGFISLKDQRHLCVKSGNRCALPDCRKELVAPAQNGDSASLVMEMAHIKGKKPGKANKRTSARYDPNMSDEERNSYDNLILLCPSCHKLVDDQPNTYTVEALRHIKAEHEDWVINSTKREIVKVTFTELEIVTKHLATNPGKLGDSLTIIPLKDKINRNGLSSSVEQLILMGMTQVKQVAVFIEKMDSLTPGFSSTLVNGFVAEYKRLHDNEFLISDVLFEALHEFACQGSADFREKAAALAVLVYLFEKCEVFEK